MKKSVLIPFVVAAFVSVLMVIYEKTIGEYSNTKLERLSYIAAIVAIPLSVIISMLPMQKLYAFVAKVVVVGLLKGKSDDFLYKLPELKPAVGLESVVHAAVSLLLKDRNEPLLIIGPPGIGKTTLGRALIRARSMKSVFGQRRYEISCESMFTVEELIREMVAQWFGECFSDIETTKSKLIDNLRERKTAILIDNVETIFEKSSRERAKLEAFLKEISQFRAVWMVVGIMGRRAPGGVKWSRLLEPAPPSPESAKEIFKGESNGALKVDDYVSELLRMVDYVPAVIVILARNASYYKTGKELLEAWSSVGFSLVSNDRYSEGERTVQAAYSFAFGNLTEEERRVAWLISFWPEGLALEFAKNVFGPKMRYIKNIIERGLLNYNAGELRYSYPTPVRQYMSEYKFDELDTVSAMTDLFLGLIPRSELVDNLTSREVLRLYTKDWNNILKAIGLGISRQETFSVSAECLFRLNRVCQETGSGRSDVLEMLNSALHFATMYNDEERIGYSLYNIGNLYRWQFQFKQALSSYYLALRQFSAIDCKIGEAWVKWAMGEVGRLTGLYLFATKGYREALKLFENDDHPRDEGKAWSRWGIGEAIRLYSANGTGRGFFQQKTGERAKNGPRLSRFRRASYLAEYGTAQEIFAKQGILKGYFCCVASLAEAARMEGRIEDAKQLFQEAAEGFDGIGYRYAQCWSLEGVGDTLLSSGDLFAARHCWRRALEVCPVGLDGFLSRRIRNKLESG